MPTNLLHFPSHFSRSLGLFALKFSGHVWLVYILTWNYKKNKNKDQFYTGHEQTQLQILLHNLFWNAWKIDSCFCSVEKQCRFKTIVKISSPIKLNFVKVLYEEKKVGVTLSSWFWTQLRFLCHCATVHRSSAKALCSTTACSAD